MLLNSVVDFLIKRKGSEYSLIPEILLEEDPLNIYIVEVDLEKVKLGTNKWFKDWYKDPDYL
jgi:hypothetical protein